MVAPERVDSVDLRIGAAPGAAAAALAALRLDAQEAVTRPVELLERAAPAADRLLAARATLEVSETVAGALSVLRIHDVPWRRLPAAGWGRPDEPRISEDWDGVRERLTLALAAPGPPGVLTPAQRQVLASVSGLRVEAERLVSVARVRELCWTVHRDHLDLRVRRWTSTRLLDVLEVECRCTPADAGFIRPAMRSFVVRHGMDPDLGLDPIELRAAAELTASTGSGE